MSSLEPESDQHGERSAHVAKVGSTVHPNVEDERRNRAFPENQREPHPMSVGRGASLERSECTGHNVLSHQEGRRALELLWSSGESAKSPPARPPTISTAVLTVRMSNFNGEGSAWFRLSDLHVMNICTLITKLQCRAKLIVLVLKDQAVFL